jgi:serine/threonine-protein kinase
MNPEAWAEIESIFQQAMLLPPSQHAAFLEQACHGNPQLRLEVESLLASLGKSGSFLENPATPEGVALLDNKSANARVGRQIGPYRILRELGHGGMGVVYLAERGDEAYHKQVAIKLLRSSVANDLLLERFHVERQILANLEHPNIARLLDGGSTSDGSPYLVMEYVEGIPITRYCDERVLTLTDRLHLFLQVCEAVQFAHQNLIIHRDLKPGNILVTPNGVPKLLDFGIAKLVTPAGTGLADSQATLPGLLMMTPEYSSPEQARGESVNTTTDIYSLGILLYRLVTGCPPYRLQSNNPAEIVRIIGEVEPEKPSAVVLQPLPIKAPPDSNERIDVSETKAPKSETKRRLSRQLRGDLDNIILKAMHKEPGRRYSSAEQLSADIRRHLDGLPVQARAATLGYRAGKFLRRNTAPVLAVALVILALAGGIIGTLRQARIARQERDHAQLEATKAEAVTRFLQRMLSSADPRTGGPEVTVASLLDQASQRIDQELRADPATEAAVRTTMGLAYLGLGMYDLAEKQIQRSLDIRRRLLGPEDIDVAMNLHHLALIVMERGDPVAAESLCRNALRLVEAKTGVDSLEMASLTGTLATLRLRLGDFEQAEQLHRRSLALRRKLVGNQHADVAESLNNLAIVLGTRGKHLEAETLHEEALSILRSLRGTEDLEIAVTMSNLASIKEALKKYPEAESLFKQVLKLRRKLLGAGHPDVAWTLHNYAYLMFDKGDYPEARRLSREVLAMRGTSLPEIHPMVPAALLILGRSLMEENRPSEALPYLVECLQLRRRVLPDTHWLVVNSKSIWGECLGKLGNRSEAGPVLVSSYEQLDVTLGSKHERTREALQRVIAFYEAGKETEKAAEFRKRQGF